MFQVYWNLPCKRKAPVAKIVLAPDWLVSANPETLLDVVWPPAWGSLPAHRVTPSTLPPSSVRRLQLFGCACARMVWDMLPTDSRNAVAVRERYADGRASLADLNAATLRLPPHAITAHHYAVRSAAQAAGYSWSDAPNLSADWAPDEAARESAKALATHAAGPAPPGGSPVAKEWQDTWNTTFAEARAYQAELVRDIFPPPGYTPSLHPDWRTSTVVAIARQMDETGDFSAVPILADALQDAGCDNEVILDRCRASSGIHCRGNWVVDLVLGRE
jgi:hypothetical protein